MLSSVVGEWDSLSVGCITFTSFPHRRHNMHNQIGLTHIKDTSGLKEYSSITQARCVCPDSAAEFHELTWIKQNDETYGTHVTPALISHNTQSFYLSEMCREEEKGGKGLILGGGRHWFSWHWALLGIKGALSSQLWLPMCSESWAF